MAKKGGGGRAAGRAGGGLSAVGMRGGSGGTAADTAGTGGGAIAGVALAAWLRYGKYVVRPIARAIYGSQKKYKVGGQRVGRRAYYAFRDLRRQNAVIAAQAGTQYIPPTEAEWRARAEALKRPKKVPPPPPKPPPPPPPRGPTRPGKGPLGGPGSIRGQILSYVVANGVVWAITKFGEWIRQREATAEEIRTGTVAGRTAGGGPRRGPGKKFPTYQPTQTEPLTPIQIYQKRMTVPKAPPKAQLEPVKISARPLPVPLEQIRITAKPLPVPVAPKPVPTWLKILKAVPPGTNPLQLIGGNSSRRTGRQLGRALTALQSAGLPSPLTQSAFSSFSAFDGTPGKVGNKTCECKPKRKKKPKAPRSVCYTGTYTERADGLTKLKRRKIPCRLSRKK